VILPQIVYPPGPRKAIRAGILALVQGMTFSSPINGATSWVTTGGRLKLWADVPSLDQPAAFVTKHRVPLFKLALRFGIFILQSIVTRVLTILILKVLMI
jgi:hypothetical protein